MVLVVYGEEPPEEVDPEGDADADTAPPCETIPVSAPQEGLSSSAS
jgi:hypothetical protein